MNKIIFSLFLLILSPVPALSWGFAAHKQINQSAVYTLPPELFKFYKPFIHLLTEKAVNPDLRRYVMHGEATKHFLDADYYEKSVPLDTIPKFWKEAVEKYSLDTLQAYGTGPWNLQLVYSQLIKAFKEKNLNAIIKLSADIGHYAADLHVPLHATQNYNGQLTNQEGIHGLWETRLYELYSNTYDFFVGRSDYLPNVSEVIWERFSQSFAALDSVLRFEQMATQKFPDKFTLKANGKGTTKVYNEAFCAYYNALLSGMVERRARASVNLVGCLWYSAWVDAGQPDLSKLGLDDLEKDDAEETWLHKLIDKAKMIGRREEH